MSDPLPDTLTIDLPGGVPLEMRRIPAGSFRMGQRGGGPDEEPVHRVVIPEDFYLGVFPVTQVQYRAMAAQCLADLDSIPGNLGADPSHFKGVNRPVEQVSWDDARCVCQWLSGSRLLPTGWVADLPTEAQWEYACRGPNQPEQGHLGHYCDFYNGDGEAALAKVGWYEGNAGVATREVGLLDPNGWGLYDMHGNVWEWCRDRWHDSPYVLREDGIQDPEVTKETPGSVGTARVLRGGSWLDAPQGCRSAYRVGRWPTYRYLDQGFRPVLLLSALPGSGGAVPTEPG